MSYSRWGSRGSGYWYTFWCVNPEENETRDNALFEICNVAQFQAKELREDIDRCIAIVREHSRGQGDIDELKVYMKEFIEDVDKEYSGKEKSCQQKNRPF